VSNEGKELTEFAAPRGFRATYGARMPDNVAKLTVFMILSVLMAMFLVELLSDSRSMSGQKNSYKAVFTDASFLAQGDQVRVSGVPVGKVDSVRLLADSDVEVSFHATMEGGLPADVGAAIRYKNLLGDRYLELLNGTSARRLPSGGTIPVGKTTPAVDLDTLTGGFKPLFQALDPEQINMLSSELIQVFQGEAGSVSNMLKSIASFTSTLADNDQVIGDLIVNLSQVLKTFNDRNDQLDTSVVQLHKLVAGLAEQRIPIATAVRSINTMTAESSALLREARPPLKENISSLFGIATALNKGSVKVNAALGGLGDALDMIAGIGVYGDFYNFYVCDIRVRFTGPDGQPAYTPWVNSDVPRCSGKPTGQ